MIHLAFIKISDLEIEGITFPAVFSDREKLVFDRLKVPKRRNEWAAGRLALKKLVQKVTPELHELSLDQIEVLNEPSGAPFIVLADARFAISVSLSHSNSYVLVACSSQVSRLGVDLEMIEPRQPEFITDYFTPAEQQQIFSAGAHEDELATLFWSGKEALLKAASLGLRMDTRKIELELTSGKGALEGWSELGIFCPPIINPPPCLVWRREGQMVQTVCWTDEPSQALKWVSLA